MRPWRKRLPPLQARDIDPAEGRNRCSGIGPVVLQRETAAGCVPETSRSGRGGGIDCSEADMSELADGWVLCHPSRPRNGRLYMAPQRCCQSGRTRQPSEGSEIHAWLSL